MSSEKISIEFANSFVGTMSSAKGDILIGSQEGGMRPYVLLYGALASCYYATFISVVEKKRLSINSARVEVDGTKRQTPPTTLETVDLKLIVRGASNKEQIMRSAQLGAEHCSIHTTISKVATINLTVEFED